MGGSVRIITNLIRATSRSFAAYFFSGWLPIGSRFGASSGLLEGCRLWSRLTALHQEREEFAYDELSSGFRINARSRSRAERRASGARRIRCVKVLKRVSGETTRSRARAERRCIRSTKNWVCENSRAVCREATPKRRRAAGHLSHRIQNVGTCRGLGR